MWEKLLSDIRKVEGKYGDTLNTPASNEQIELLKKIVKEKFDHVLPEQYVNFLKTVNGLEFNGFIFYGVDSSLLEVQNNQTVYGLLIQMKFGTKMNIKSNICFLEKVI